MKNLIFVLLSLILIFEIAKADGVSSLFKVQDGVSSLFKVQNDPSNPIQIIFNPKNEPEKKTIIIDIDNDGDSPPHGKFFVTTDSNSEFENQLIALNDEVLKLLKSNSEYFNADVIGMFKQFVANGYDWGTTTWTDIQLAMKVLPKDTTVYEKMSKRGYSQEETLTLYNKLIELSYHAKLIKTMDEDLATDNAVKTLFFIGPLMAGCNFKYGDNRLHRCNILDHGKCYDLVGAVMLLKVTRGNLRALFELNGGELMYQVGNFKYNYPRVSISTNNHSLAIIKGTDHVLTPVYYDYPSSSNGDWVLRACDTAGGINNMSSYYSSTVQKLTVTDLSLFQEECSTILKWTIKHPEYFNAMHAILMVTSKLDSLVVGSYEKRLIYSRQLISLMQKELDGIGGSVIPSNVSYSISSEYYNNEEIEEAYITINGETNNVNHYSSSDFNGKNSNKNMQRRENVVSSLYSVSSLNAQRYTDEEFWNDFAEKYSDWDNLDQNLAIFLNSSSSILRNDTTLSFKTPAQLF